MADTNSIVYHPRTSASDMTGIAHDSAAEHKTMEVPDGLSVAMHQALKTEHKADSSVVSHLWLGRASIPYWSPKRDYSALSL